MVTSANAKGATIVAMIDAVAIDVANFLNIIIFTSSLARRSSAL
jgi:hypothetical protein